MSAHTTLLVLMLERYKQAYLELGEPEIYQHPLNRKPPLKVPSPRKDLEVQVNKTIKDQWRLIEEILALGHV